MSLTISSLMVALAGLLAKTLGLDVTDGELDQFVLLAMQLGGILFAWYGRWNAGGVSLLGARRSR